MNFPNSLLRHVADKSVSGERILGRFNFLYPSIVIEQIPGTIRCSNKHFKQAVPFLEHAILLAEAGFTNCGDVVCANVHPGIRAGYGILCSNFLDYLEKNRDREFETYHEPWAVFLLRVFLSFVTKDDDYVAPESLQDYVTPIIDECYDFLGGWIDDECRKQDFAHIEKRLNDGRRHNKLYADFEEELQKLLEHFPHDHREFEALGLPMGTEAFWGVIITRVSESLVYHCGNSWLYRVRELTKPMIAELVRQNIVWGIASEISGSIEHIEILCNLLECPLPTEDPWNKLFECMQIDSKFLERVPYVPKLSHK